MIEPKGQLFENLSEVKKSGERAASLTNQLLAYSRKQVLAMRVLNLNTLVSNIRNMLSRIIGEDLTLTCKQQKDLGNVKADPSQMEQVILNLVVNARDATPSGGRITIETSDVYLDDSIVSLHPEILPGKYVLLSVSDTGSGIEPHIKARIFEPFFTTKEFGQGSGMGLSMVQGIVNQTGGYVYVYSETGLGTTFKVYLPMSDHPGAAGNPGLAPVGGDFRGGETILLAEDEDSVRKLTRTILGSAGYTILEARDGMEGESICDGFAGPIHLLLTDVVMPRKNGRELAEHIGKRKPGAKVIFMSGYTDDAIVRHGLMGLRSSFIQKPFSPLSLLRKIRELLDAPKSEIGDGRDSA